jgi:hypothetical protein
VSGTTDGSGTAAKIATSRFERLKNLFFVRRS